MGVAALPLPARGEGSALHTIVAALAFVLLAVWPWFGTHDRAVGLLRPQVARPASIVLLVTVASLAVTLVLPPGVFGLHERLVVGALVLWPAATAAVAWWRAGWPVGAPHSKHILSTVAFTAIALLGGITATNLAPVTAQRHRTGAHRPLRTVHRRPRDRQRLFRVERPARPEIALPAASGGAPGGR